MPNTSSCPSFLLPIIVFLLISLTLSTTLSFPDPHHPTVSSSPSLSTHSFIPSKDVHKQINQSPCPSHTFIIVDYFLTISLPQHSPQLASQVKQVEDLVLAWPESGGNLRHCSRCGFCSPPRGRQPIQADELVIHNHNHSHNHNQGHQSPVDLFAAGIRASRSVFGVNDQSNVC